MTGRTVIRRPHRKARTGCTLCKKRRVKVSSNASSTACPEKRTLMDGQCGEEKPQCKNCEAHAAECIYEAVTSRRTTPKPGPSASTPNTPTGQDDPPGFTLEHMELLHHYTASTSLTFSSTAQAREVWQDYVPRLAMHAEYVLQTLLAVSALHLSQLRPHSRSSYWSIGVQLYHAALSRAQKEMENVTEENCTEIYIFSMLTCFYSLAQNGELATRSDQGESLDDEEKDLIGWVFLFRGTKALLTMPYQKLLHAGPLAPIFQQGAKRAVRLRAYPTLDLGHVMDELQEIVPDPAEQVMYKDAIQHLQKSFHAVYGRPSGEVETTDIFVWLFDVSDEYMDRLKRHEGPALAIFICFSLLVGQLQGVWWAKGWGEWISVRLRRRLLDEERSFSGRLMELLALVNDTRHEGVGKGTEMEEDGSPVVSMRMET